VILALDLRDKASWAAQSSLLAPGTAEKLIAEAARLLAEVKNNKNREVSYYDETSD